MSLTTLLLWSAMWMAFYFLQLRAYGRGKKAGQGNLEIAYTNGYLKGISEAYSAMHQPGNPEFKRARAVLDQIDAAVMCGESTVKLEIDVNRDDE